MAAKEVMSAAAAEDVATGSTAIAGKVAHPAHSSNLKIGTIATAMATIQHGYLSLHHEGGSICG